MYTVIKKNRGNSGKKVGDVYLMTLRIYNDCNFATRVNRLRNFSSNRAMKKQ